MKKLIKGLKGIVPGTLKRFIHYKIAELKKPQMIWGYRDSTGLFRRRTRISDTVYMYHPERIVISDNVFIWHYTILDGTGGLQIGEGSQIGAWVGIFTHSSHIAVRIYGNHYQEIAEQDKIGYPIDKVAIGKYVFVGAGSKILPGVTVGDGALITAGTLVRKNVKEFEIVAGNPSEVIGDTRELDKKYIQKDGMIQKWYMEWQSK